jgi:hypothetical protein
MTVSSQITRADYQGNNVTTQFTVPFYFLDPTHLKVLRTDNSVSPPSVTTLVLNSDYSVAGAGEQGGGTVTATVAPTGTQVITILRSVPFTQLIHYVPNSPFPAASHEQALDQLTMEVQETEEQISRTIAIPINEVGQNVVLPPASVRAGHAFVFDSLGGPGISTTPFIDSATVLAEAHNDAAAQISAATPGIESAAVGIANANAASMIAGIQTPTFQSFAPTVLLNGADFTAGTSTSVTIPAPTSGRVIAGVFMDGVYQGRTQYTLDSTGTILTFSAAIPLGITEIDVMYFSPGLLGSFIQAGIGSIPRSYQDRQQDTISIFDFMTDAQKANVYLRLGTIDVTAAVRAAIAYGASSQKKVHAPAGYYLMDGIDPVTATSPVSLVGDGKYNTIFTTNNIAGQLFSFSGPYVLLEDFGLQVNTKGATTAALLHVFCETENVNRVMFNNYGLGARLGGNVGSYTDCDFLDVGSTSSVGWEVNGYAGGLNLYNPFFYVPTITPTAGLHFIACGGVLISGANIIRQGNDILVTPGAGQQADSIQIVNSFIDSANSAAINVAPAAGGVVARMWLTQVECDSSAGNGIILNGTAGQILGVSIINLQVLGATNNGLEIAGAGVQGVDIVGGVAAGNGGSGISISSGVQGVRISNVLAGAGYGFGPNDIGIFADASCTGVVVQNCDVNGNTAANIGGNNPTIDVINTAGWVTANSGTGQILAGQTLATVPHGLSGIPGIQNIQLTPVSFSAANPFALDGAIAPTATAFSVACATPAAANIQFAWRATCNGQI